MKILHVIPYFYPAWAYGGPPRAVYEIAKRQVGLGHDVTVLTTNALEQNEVLSTGEVKIEGIKVIRLRNISNFLMWNLHFPTPFMLNDKVGIKNYDVIHLHETRTLLNYLVVRLIKDKTRVIFSPWGTIASNNSLTLIKKVFDLIFLKKIKNTIAITLGQNNHEMELLRLTKIGQSNKLLPLGIDISFFKNPPKKTKSRSELNFNEKDFIFVFLGRYSAAKGLELLVRSFHQLTHREDKVKLLLVGRNDGYENTLKSLIKTLGLKEKVIIKGPFYGKDRLKIYTAADCFVFTPIIFEETSTACLEALACQTPVITTKKAEIPFLDQTDGVFQINDNINEVVKAMNMAIKNHNKIKVNHQKVRDNFDWDNIVKKLQEYYLL